MVWNLSAPQSARGSPPRPDDARLAQERARGKRHQSMPRHEVFEARRATSTADRRLEADDGEVGRFEGPSDS